MWWTTMPQDDLKNVTLCHRDDIATGAMMIEHLESPSKFHGWQSKSMSILLKKQQLWATLLAGKSGCVWCCGTSNSPVLLG
jgi:hypothetical protein